MTKRMRRLLVAVVGLAGGLLMLVGAFRWHSGRTPAFRFLGDQRPVYHTWSQDASMDIYAVPGEFESVCAEVSKRLLCAGFVDISFPDLGNRYREFTLPGLDRIAVYVRRETFGKGTEYVSYYRDVPCLVSVEIAQSRQSLRRYLSQPLRRRIPPPPPVPKLKRATESHG